MKYFLCVLGMVLILEGLPYFAFPEKIKAYLMKIMGYSGPHPAPPGNGRHHFRSYPGLSGKELILASYPPTA
jgi:hypothetical protein